MRLLLLASLLLVTGCAKSYIVNISDPDKDAHYVLVQTGVQGSSKVYDCMARPDGKTWDPTCVKAKMLADPPGKDEGKGE